MKLNELKRRNSLNQSSFPRRKKLVLPLNDEKRRQLKNASTWTSSDKNRKKYFNRAEFKTIRNMNVANGQIHIFHTVKKYFNPKFLDEGKMIHVVEMKVGRNAVPKKIRKKKLQPLRIAI